MNKNELKLYANYIKKLASFPDASERIEVYLDSLFANQQLQKDTFNEPENGKNKAVSSLVYFSHTFTGIEFN